jgi:hypothetical protein
LFFLSPLHTTACCRDVYGNYNETFSGTLMNTNMAVNCMNCGPELTTLGNFTALQAVAYDHDGYGELSITCTNCTALTTMGNFNPLQYVSSG